MESEISHNGGLCYFKGKLFNGVLYNNYSKGTLLYESNYKDGKQDGIFKVWLQNGQLCFSEDKSGIFNLVCKQIESKINITNIIGGAFMPDMNKHNRILYSLYKNDKLKYKNFFVNLKLELRPNTKKCSYLPGNH
mgnify:CR=1 FL=1